VNAAAARRPRTSNARLLVVDTSGGIVHQSHRDLPSLLDPGDLIVANDAATMPAMLTGVHEPTRAAIETRLAGLTPGAVSTMTFGANRPWPARFTAVLFGAGDHRTATEHRPPPPVVQVGDALIVASLRARVVAILGHPRLIDLEFEQSREALWEGIARHGRPIQYAHVPPPLAVWDTWTSIAAHPVAFEAPSAGFVPDWSMLGALRRRGIRFATLTHAAGISSTGDPELDARLPFDEPYVIPSSTAMQIALVRSAGQRVIAIGTTVVRALESAAGGGTLAPYIGDSSLFIVPGFRFRVVDAMLTNFHLPESTLLMLVSAFAGREEVLAAYRHAVAGQYRFFSYGDAMFITPAPGAHA
jgi:S-adenosylmethionine:tRNA ribosyltransferase-isomerase